MSHFAFDDTSDSAGFCLGKFVGHLSTVTPGSLIVGIGAFGSVVRCQFLLTKSSIIKKFVSR